MEIIAVDPVTSQQGIATYLLNHYAKGLSRTGIQFIMSEVVDEIWEGKTNLEIANLPSINLHKKIGAVQAGVTPVFTWPYSYLGSKGRFREKVYLLSVKDFLKRD